MRRCSRDSREDRASIMSMTGKVIGRIKSNRSRGYASMEEAYQLSPVGKARKEEVNSWARRLKEIYKIFRQSNGMIPSLRALTERYMNKCTWVNNLKIMNWANTVLYLVLAHKKVHLHLGLIFWKIMRTTLSLKCHKSRRQLTKLKTISSLNQKWTLWFNIDIRA